MVKFTLKKRAQLFIKRNSKGLLCTFTLLTCFLIASSMDYEDEVMQAKVNCNSASYVNDNPSKCEVIK